MVPAAHTCRLAVLIVLACLFSEVLGTIRRGTHLSVARQSTTAAKLDFDGVGFDTYDDCHDERSSLATLEDIFAEW